MAKFDQFGLDPAVEEQIFPTKWTHTQKAQGHKYMIKARDNQPAPIPGQRVTGFTRDGSHRVECSVPHAPYEKWIKPCGSVVMIVMRTTRVVDTDNGGVSMDNGPYHMQMREELLRTGHVHYETGLGAVVNGKPTHYPTREAWVAARTGLIREYQGRQAEEMADADKRYTDETKAKKLEIQSALVEAFNEFNTNQQAKRERTKDK